MWIKTQTRNCLINMENIDYICVDWGRKGISCKLKDESLLLLATYNTVDECNKVFDGIMMRMRSMFTIIELPLGGDIDKWYNG